MHSQSGSVDMPFRGRHDPGLVCGGRMVVFHWLGPHRRMQMLGGTRCWCPLPMSGRIEHGEQGRYGGRLTQRPLPEHDETIALLAPQDRELFPSPSGRRLGHDAGAPLGARREDAGEAHKREFRGWNQRRKTRQTLHRRHHATLRASTSNLLGQAICLSMKHFPFRSAATQSSPS